MSDIDADTLVWELSSAANPSTRQRVGFTPAGLRTTAGTVHATPAVLREHRSYIELHRIELVAYRFDSDANGGSNAVSLAKLNDPVQAIDFAKDAGNRVMVMAANYGPYCGSPGQR